MPTMRSVPDAQHGRETSAWSRLSEKWEQMADAGYKAPPFASDQRKREPLHAFVMAYRQDVVDS